MIRIQPAQVMALSDEIGAKSGQIKTALSDLDTRTSALRASWSGEARDSYSVAQAAWDKQISEMEALLKQISVKLTEIAQDYVSRDKKGAGLFQ